MFLWKLTVWALVGNGRGMGLWMCLWKLWKWFVHAFTGTCELYRLACSTFSLEKRTSMIDKSMRLSKYKELNDVCRGVYDVDQSLAIVKRIKKWPNRGSDDGILASLSYIVSLATLKKEVQALRSETYSEDNTEHKRILLELWDLLMPSVPLKSRITKQWQEIGYQGTDPATDFRGMGVLGLQCLHYFAKHHNGKARSIHLHSHHPKYGYPLAIVSIDLTSLLFSWTESGIIDNYMYRAAIQRPLSINEFMETHCYLLSEFDKFWISKDPENVMAFNAVRTEFASQLLQELIKEDNKIVMRLSGNSM